MSAETQLHSTQASTGVRELTRYRTLVEERRAGRQPRAELLKEANIKLSSVASNIWCVGRAMLEEIMAGRQMSIDSDLARGQMRSKIPEWRKR